MTNEIKKNYDKHLTLTLDALDALKARGYQYLQVQGFTLDHHPEYIEPYYMMLVPLKSLTNKGNIDVYEDISSDTILNWAKQNEHEDLHIFLANAS
jgi:hypothetical protein